TLVILALEDREGYDAAAGNAAPFPKPAPALSRIPPVSEPTGDPLAVDSAPVIPPLAAPEAPQQISAPALPPKRFTSFDGRVESVSSADRRIVVRPNGKEPVVVRIVERTKIYTFAGDQFSLLKF